MTLRLSQKSLTILQGQSQLKMTFFQNPGSSTKSDLAVESAISDSGTKSFFVTTWGGGELIRILNDLGLESEIPDFIARSESAKNDFFSKSRLLPLYASSCKT